MSDKEIVLTSGKFASIREPIMLDIMMTYHENPMVMMSFLVTRLAKLDGEPITALQFSSMSVQEAAPIMNVIGEYLKVLPGKEKGIA